MRKNRFGRIVFVNGAFCKDPDPWFPINSAVNCALQGFAKAISKDLGRSGIRVNVVNPGVVSSPLWDDTANDLANATGATLRALNEGIINRIPLGRFADPSDVANAVVFLSSNEASYLNGASITVDGGATSAI